MPSFTVYPNGASSSSSFYLYSSWSSSTGRPSTPTKEQYFDLTGIPSGATNIKTTIYSTLSSSAYGGWGRDDIYTSPDYPLANGVSFSDDTGFVSANQTFSDMTATTQVTISFRSKHSGSNSGGGSLTFTGTYIKVTYDLPLATWDVNSSRISPGNYLGGTVTITDENKDYQHYFYVKYSGSTDSESPSVQVAKSSAQIASFSILIPSHWASSVASYVNGVSAYVYYQMWDSQGNVINESDPVTITQYVGDRSPVAGTQSFTVSDTYNGSVVQNYSSVRQTLSGYGGDKYGSTVTSVRIEDSNGASKTVSYPTANIVWEYGLLRGSGSTRFTATVTDDAGNSASTSTSVYVNPYTPVSITLARVGRYNAETGLADAKDGEGAYAIVGYTYTSLGNNTPVLTVDYRSTSIQGKENYANYTSGSQIIFATSGVDLTETFTVSLTISDGISKTTVQRKFGTAEVYIRMDPANNAIGFGCYPTAPSTLDNKTGCVEIADTWDFRVGGQSISELIANSSNSKIIASATRPTDPEPGTIWLDIS